MVADVQSSVAVEEMTLHAFVFSVEAVAYLDVMILRKAAVFVLLQEQELLTVTNPNEC